MEQESIYDWLWLLLVFGAGSRKIWKLLEQYETPQKVRQVLQTEFYSRARTTQHSFHHK